MSDNDGYSVVRTRIRQQMMVRDPILEPEKLYTVKRIVEELYEVRAHSRKEAVAMGKDDPYSVKVLKETAKEE